MTCILVGWANGPATPRWTAVRLDIDTYKTQLQKYRKTVSQCPTPMENVDFRGFARGTQATAGCVPRVSRVPPLQEIKEETKWITKMTRLPYPGRTRQTL